MPLIPALGRWISEFEASLVYKVSSRTAKATEKPSRKTKKKKEEEEAAGWTIPLIPALEEQRQADLRVCIQPGLHSDNYEAIRIIAKLLTFGGGNSHWLPELTSNLKSSNGTELTGRFLPSQVGWFCFGFGFRGSSPLNGLVVTLF